MLLKLLTKLLLWLMLFSSYVHATSEHLFNLPPANLQQRLLDIADQSGWQLSAAALSEEVVLTHLDGTFTLDEVLIKTLTNSHYQYSLVHSQQRIFITASESHEVKEHDFERIIVTGVSGKNRSIINSSIAITQLSTQQLTKHTPYSSAEILKGVTGFWVEDSGGETNNNVSPRGLRGGEGFRFISLMEDGLPITYDGIWSDFFLRPDLTHQTIEAVRGGSSGIFTLNGPAAMVNYIGRRGTETPFNLVKLSQAINYGYTRLDGVLSGPINDNFFYTVGGFYRASNGIRESGFNSDLGGQFSTRLSWLNDDFELDFSYKHLNDKTSFYAPLVMQNYGAINELSSLPYDYGTLLSNDLRWLEFHTPEGITKHDLEDAQHTLMNSYTMEFKSSLSEHVSINNNARYSSLSNRFYTLMNLGNDTILDAKSRLQHKDISDFKNSFSDTRLQAKYLRHHDKMLISDPEKLNGNGLITSSYPLHSNYKQQQFINHFNTDYQQTHWSLSLGHIYAHSDFSSLPLDLWLGQILTDVKHQPERLDIVLVDEQDNVVANFTEQGFLSYAGPVYLKGQGRSRSHSFYASVDWQVTDHLRVDLALRNEHLNLTSTTFQGKTSQTNTSKRYYSHYSPASTLSDSFSQNALTLGANYQISEQLAIFTRYANAFEMPRLINYGNGRGWAKTAAQQEQQNFGQPISLTLSEVGLRYQAPQWQFSGTVFDTNFDPLPFTVYRGAASSQQAILINTQTQGLEFEYYYQHGKTWQFSALGIWQDAGFYGIPKQLPQSQYNGNQITRTPELQLRLTPQYQAGPATVALTWSYIGERYSDIANQFSLPAYQTWDLFAELTISEQLSAQFEVKNMTNTLGLTEGNPRDDLSHQEPLFYGRPIFGRTIKVALSYQF
ncbi:TonB-dependent receptor [Pseudoalteromonas sp. NEC-BIFX-2020_015]|nr:TonB-dependent receptor [Pseudoalteromonas sp. NEC-BIFX-2020_015]